MTDPTLLSVSGLSKTFVKPLGALDRITNALRLSQREAEAVRAVDNVSFQLRPGEALGLVGESGCGKSTIARMVMRLLHPTTGQITFNGADLDRIDNKDLLKIQMVFQDPYSSLNPRKRIYNQIDEAVSVHNIVPRDERESYLEGIFEQCGIDPGLTRRYAHQFSGGQRQRFGIARALAMQPALMVCDEPVAALDVSIQAQIINLFSELRAARGLAYLFISHDLSVVRHLCDRVAVMYLGRIVEEGPVEEVLDNPRHPYTQALQQASPRISATKQMFEPIRGEIPSPLDPPSGCYFHPRCPRATPECRSQVPASRETGGGVTAACHLV